MCIQRGVCFELTGISQKNADRKHIFICVLNKSVRNTFGKFANVLLARNRFRILLMPPNVWYTTYHS